jgi:hypothetical protein
MKGIFIEPDDEINFKANGYLIKKVFQESDINTIINKIKPFYKSNPKGFTYSLIDNELTTNENIKNVLLPILTPFLNTVFANYKIFAPSFLTKSNKETFDFYLHQDWNYTDENNWYSATVWIPLCDVTPQNGCVYLIPGSHSLFNTIRSGSLDTARIPVNENLSALVKNVAMKKGEALFFNPAIFHGSYPNHSNELRVAVTAIAQHKEAPFIHYFQEKNSNKLSGYFITENDFLGNLSTLAAGKIPSDGSAIYSHQEYAHQIIESELLLLSVLNTQSQ